MAAFFIAFVLTAPVRWVQQPPRPPVVRVQKLRPKRKRVRQVAHRKPPTVWIEPDIVEVYPDWWAAERARMKQMAAWCVGQAVR